MSAQIYRKVPIHGKGNGLLANADIPSGSIILTVSDPALAILNTSSLYKMCYECFRRDSVENGTKACTGCRSVYYCGKACQTKSWKRDHKYDCKIYASSKQERRRALPTPTRGLITLLARGKRETAPGGLFDKMKELQSNQEELMKNEETKMDVVLQPKMACHKLKLAAEDEALAQLLCCILHTNAFQLIDHTEDEIGLLFDPLLSQANHSCVPNAFIAVDGRQARLISLLPIKKDEEICISYVDSTAGTKTRQATIKDKYCFSCICPRCKDDKTVYQVYRDLLPVLEQSSESFIFNLPGPSELTRLCSAAPDLDSTPVSPDNPIRQIAQRLLPHLNDSTQCRPAKSPTFDLLHVLYDAAIAEPIFSVAYILQAHFTFHLEPIRHPSPIHPNRASSFLALGRLQHFALTRVAPGNLLTTAKKLEVVDLVRGFAHEHVETELAILTFALVKGAKAFGPESRFVDDVKKEVAELTQNILAGGGGSQGVKDLWEEGLQGRGGVVAVRVLERLSRLGGIDIVTSVVRKLADGVI